MLRLVKEDNIPYENYYSERVDGVKLISVIFGGTFPNIFILENVPQNFNYHRMQAVTEYHFGIEFIDPLYRPVHSLYLLSN